MFGIAALRQELEDLKAANKSLRRRVEELETVVEPFRIGDLDRPLYFGMPVNDTRPKVTVSKAIELIMDHLKIKFGVKKAISQCIEVEKIIRRKGSG